MKYIEQRIEELEKQINFLKSNNKLNDIGSTGLITKSDDYMYNHSTNLIHEPDLNTAFDCPYDKSEFIKSPLDTITISLSSITDDTLPNPNYIDSSDLSQKYLSYPDIIGSWDGFVNDSKDWINTHPISSWNDFDWNTMKDWASFNEKDEIPPYTNCQFESDFDKKNEMFLKCLNSIENKIQKEFGKIVSKFKILNHEWEMDGYGYIVSNDDDKKIVITDHGNPKIVDKNYLNDIISGYKERIQETQRALFLIK
jgi:hypothetical protein